MTVQIRVGDARQLLKAMPADSVHCVVTSPPYWGLRDYGVAGQIGLEATLGEFIDTMVSLFREVHRVLRSDGTCWLNLGDSYFSDGGLTDGDCQERRGAYRIGRRPMDNYRAHRKRAAAGADMGLKPKDLCLVPYRVAIALQEDGWWVRSDVVWHKPNGMPEAVKDRPVRAHEAIFLLTKSARYFYDADATREPAKAPEASTPEDVARAFNRKRATTVDPRQDAIEPPPIRSNGNKTRKVATEGENGRTNSHLGYSFPWTGSTALKRDVWTVTSKPFRGAHFATYPPDLIEPCIKAGCPAGGTVLDPFGGAGTTGMVADRLGRDAILLELNPEYAAMARDRIQADGGMMSHVLVDGLGSPTHNQPFSPPQGKLFPQPQSKE